MNWAERVKELMRAMGWPKALMATKLGLADESSVLRLLRGGRPTVEVLLNLQRLEKEHAGAIEARKGKRGARQARLWPPAWVECRERWWDNEPETKPPSRPADLAPVATSRTDPAVVLTGRFDPANYPGRSLRVVDWTPAGRARYAADRAAEAGRHAADKEKPRKPIGIGAEGKIVS